MYINLTFEIWDWTLLFFFLLFLNAFCKLFKSPPFTYIFLFAKLSVNLKKVLETIQELRTALDVPYWVYQISKDKELSDVKVLNIDFLLSQLLFQFWSWKLQTSNGYVLPGSLSYEKESISWTEKLLR
jgi:hypothetical protein